jgi:hypothetical protein
MQWPLCVRSFRCHLRPLLHTPCSRGWLKHDVLCPLCRACTRRHLVVQTYTVHTRDTSIRPSQVASEYIHVYVSIDAGYDTTSMRSACKCLGRKVRNTIADMPETKRNEKHLSPAVHQQASGNGSSRHASISRAGPPTSFLPGGDPTPWSRSESQFSEGMETKDLLTMRAIDLHR